jgi:hypothetical protein
MRLQTNDIIPLGWSPGTIRLLVNDNGLNFLPPGSAIGRRGNGGYWDVDVAVDGPNRSVALRLLGVSAADIAAASAAPLDRSSASFRG